MYWIYKIEREELPIRYFVGTETHINSLIRDGEPISFYEEYKTPLLSSDSKLIIAGAGRAGTSFLVRILTRMNYHTGYLPYKETFNKEKRAGCEYGVRSLGELKEENRIIEDFSHYPFVLKTPVISWYLKIMALVLDIKIGHVLIPIRDHIESAISRVKEGLPLNLIGKDVKEQILANDILLGKSVEACVIGRIPFSLARFPELVTDKEYCWHVLETALLDCIPEEPNYEEFSRIFDELSDPSIIKYSGAYEYKIL